MQFIHYSSKNVIVLNSYSSNILIGLIHGFSIGCIEETHVFGTYKQSEIPNYKVLCVMI